MTFDMAENHTNASELTFGTPEHAFAITARRHPGVRDGLQWLTYSHLPPALKAYSSIFYSAAVNLISAVQTDSPELTTALNFIISAKDSGVRSGIRHDTGRAGSAPRPQEVVRPPRLADIFDDPATAKPLPPQKVVDPPNLGSHISRLSPEVRREVLAREAAEVDPVPDFAECLEDTPDGPCGLRAGHPIGPMHSGHNGHMVTG